MPRKEKIMKQNSKDEITPEDGHSLQSDVIPYLSLAESERLALLLEEIGEVLQIVGKIQRHGYESKHPDGGPTNREALEIELGHVHYAIKLLTEEEDIDSEAVLDAFRMKHKTIKKYLHYNEV